MSAFDTDPIPADEGAWERPLDEGGEEAANWPGEGEEEEGREEVQGGEEGDTHTGEAVDDDGSAVVDGAGTEEEGVKGVDDEVVEEVAADDWDEFVVVGGSGAAGDGIQAIPELTEEETKLLTNETFEPPASYGVEAVKQQEERQQQEAIESLKKNYDFEKPQPKKRERKRGDATTADPVAQEAMAESQQPLPPHQQDDIGVSPVMNGAVASGTEAPEAATVTASAAAAVNPSSSASSAKHGGPPQSDGQGMSASPPTSASPSRHGGQPNPPLFPSPLFASQHRRLLRKLQREQQWQQKGIAYSSNDDDDKDQEEGGAIGSDGLNNDSPARESGWGKMPNNQTFGSPLQNRRFGGGVGGGRTLLSATSPQQELVFGKGGTRLEAVRGGRSPSQGGGARFEEEVEQPADEVPPNNAAMAKLSSFPYDRDSRGHVGDVTTAAARREASPLHQSLYKASLVDVSGSSASALEMRRINQHNNNNHLHHNNNVNHPNQTTSANDHVSNGRVPLHTSLRAPRVVDISGYHEGGGGEGYQNTSAVTQPRVLSHMSPDNRDSLHDALSNVIDISGFKPSIAGRGDDVVQKQPIDLERDEPSVIARHYYAQLREFYEYVYLSTHSHAAATSSQKQQFDLYKEKVSTIPQVLFHYDLGPAPLAASINSNSNAFYAGGHNYHNGQHVLPPPPPIPSVYKDVPYFDYLRQMRLGASRGPHAVFHLNHQHPDERKGFANPAVIARADELFAALRGKYSEGYQAAAAAKGYASPLHPPSNAAYHYGLAPRGGTLQNPMNTATTADANLFPFVHYKM